MSRQTSLNSRDRSGRTYPSRGYGVNDTHTDYWVINGGKTFEGSQFTFHRVVGVFEVTHDLTVPVFHTGTGTLPGLT